MAKKAIESLTEETTEPVEQSAVEQAAESASLEAVDEKDIVKEEVEVKTDTLTEKDADEFFKDTVYADAFMRRTVTVPSKKKVKAAFHEDEQTVGDEVGEIDTYATQRRKEYEILSNSAKSDKPKVLYGRIDGVEEIERGGKRTCEAICHLIADDRKKINTDDEMKSGIYKIKIPAPMLFFYDQEKYSTPEGYETLKRNLDMRVKSIVEFVVYDVNPEEEEVLASSIVAKQILQYDYYLKEDKRTKQRLIEPGKKAKGYITNINSRGVTVDVFGSEIFVKNSELGWRYINNALNENKYFYVGKPVSVRILKVEKKVTEIFGQKYPYLDVEGSIRLSYASPNQMFFEKFIKGQKYTGEIAYRLTTGEYIVNLGAEGDGINGDRLVCMCKAPSIELGGTPYIGQTVSVVITIKNAEKSLLYGAFTYMQG